MAQEKPKPRRRIVEPKKHQREPVKRAPGKPGTTGQPEERDPMKRGGTGPGREPMRRGGNDVEREPREEKGSIERE